MLTDDETRHPMVYIKTYDGIGWFVTGETGAVERPARFMSVEEALGWCVQHRPGAEVTIKRYDGSQEPQDAVLSAREDRSASLKHADVGDGAS